MTPPSQRTLPASVRACAAVGLDRERAGALRAFAQAIPAAEFEHAFARRFEARADDAPTPLEAVFLALLLERESWAQADWLDALGDAWHACRAARHDPALLAKACACLAEATQDVLGRASARHAELDVADAVTCLAQAIHATIALRDDARPPGDAVAPAGNDCGAELPDRAQLHHALAQALQSSDAQPVGLVLLQVDWDLAMRRAGGARLEDLRRHVTRTLSQVIRPQDRLYAPAPGEWALLMPGLVSAAQVQLAGQRLVEQCEALTDDELPRLRGKVHAGAAFAPDDDDSPAGIERAARAALHCARGSDRPVMRYERRMLAELEHELALEREIAMHAARPPFMVWLQPQVHLASGRCAAAEALLRWQRPDGAWVPPPEIVGTALRLGLMPEISYWLVMQVVRSIRELSDAGLAIPVSLNLVAGDLHDDELPALVRQVLGVWKVPAARLTLEITEEALIADRARAARIIGELRAMGCGVSLDDFGTGFSSFAYLRDLPVSEVKIDRLFIEDLLASPRDQAIVAAVHALARGLSLTVVAEGVEDAATADALRRMGCDHAQGFLYAPAMPLADFIAWVRNGQLQPAGAST